MPKNGKTAETKEIAVKNNYSLDKIKDMTMMAKVLKNHVVHHKLYTNIKGKNYAHVEGWQFAGGLMGLHPRVTSVENLSNDKELKWRADVEIVETKTGRVISNGFAICSNKEAIKKSFDEYAVLSMAQTRAIGKAYRNLIGWVMKLAGYEGTPSEEMHRVDQTPAEPKPEKEEKPIIEAECHSCGNPITKQEAEFSKNLYGKPLCRNCQKEAKK